MCLATLVSMASLTTAPDGRVSASAAEATPDDQMVSLRCTISTSLSLMWLAPGTPFMSTTSAAAPISTSPSPVLHMYELRW